MVPGFSHRTIPVNSNYAGGGVPDEYDARSIGRIEPPLSCTVEEKPVQQDRQIAEADRFLISGAKYRTLDRFLRKEK